MTGHWPHGVPTSRDNPGDKWFIRALDNTPYLENRTYEAIGPHFQGNPYGLPDDVLVPHGAEVIEVVRTFRDIRDYEGLYQVSNLGNVRSLNWRNTGTVRNLALKSHNRGDLKVELANRGKCKTFMVHRLVALHFVPGYQDGFVVSHINERKTDNRADNLEWVSQAKNTEYTLSKHSSVSDRCRSNKSQIVQLKENGEQVVWECILAIVRATGFNAWSIKQCCEGKRKHAYGYKWQYAT